MSNPPNDPNQAAEEVPPEPLHCTKLLLASLQETKEEGWQFNEDGLQKSLDLFGQEFSGPNMGAAVDQMLRVVGFLHSYLNRADLAQRLLDEVEPRVTQQHVDRVKEALAVRMAEQTDEARDQFAKLLGPPPNLVDAEPREKIDFQLPKGNVKG